MLEKAEQTYSDYPEAVKNNAKKVLKYVDQNGWGPCGTPVGKQRANQLANGEPLSVDTIKRMFSYLSRHEVDLESSSSYEDGCGLLMYDAWGGKEGLVWSRNKIKELEKTSDMWFVKKGLNQGFTDSDMKQGIVSGYFAMFGNKDLDGDVIEPGAFSKTIMERGPQGKQLIKYLLDHDKNKVVAKMNNLYEDQRGLRYEAKIGTHAAGQDFQKMIESELINQHSFGFRTIKEEFDQEAKMNRIREVMMYEGSAVQFLGANPETTFIDLKSEADAFEYLTRLEKFVKTSDATDETLEKLENQLKSLLEMLKPTLVTLVEKEAVQVETITINELKKQFESWKI
jgi:HK97 family phage prohead protease